MRNPIAATLVVVLLTTPAAALAQDVAAVPPPQKDGQQQAARLPEPVDPPTAAQLGISLDRIRQELREAPATRGNHLRYDFHVEVYGTNPKVDFFKDFDLSPNGAVRYGGMTHSEFLNVVTPQAFRAPSGDILGLAMFAIQQLGNKWRNESKK